MPTDTAAPSLAAIMCFLIEKFSKYDERFLSMLSGTPVKKSLYFFLVFYKVSTKIIIILLN
jgi:hypothetical protein